MNVLKNFFKAMEADFDIFSKSASRQSFDDEDDSLEHPDIPDENNNSENNQNDNTNNETQNTNDENPEDDDGFDDLDDGTGDFEEGHGEEDPDNEPESEIDEEEKNMKQNLKENFIYLYDVLVSNVESMEGSKSFRPEFDTEKYLTVKNILIELKEIIYKIITIRFDKLSSVDLQRKFNAAEKTYDVATNMLEVYFNEGISNMENHDNNKSKAKVKEK